MSATGATAPTRWRGLALALVQVVLVTGIGLSLLVDRARLPRAWVPVAAFDPDLPIRGRYAALAPLVELDAPEATAPDATPSDVTAPDATAADRAARDGTSHEWHRVRARLEVRGERIVAVADPRGALLLQPREGLWTPEEPLLYFLPEHVADPTVRPAGERLWVEVSVPPDGPPRPIRLALQRGDAPREPLVPGAGSRARVP